MMMSSSKVTLYSQLLKVRTYTIHTRDLGRCSLLQETSAADHVSRGEKGDQDNKLDKREEVERKEIRARHLAFVKYSFNIQL